jgi:hypothetical protein
MQRLGGGYSPRPVHMQVFMPILLNDIVFLTFLIKNIVDSEGRFVKGQARRIK